MLEHELEGFLNPRTGSLVELLRSAIWYNSMSFSGVSNKTPRAVVTRWQGSDNEDRYRYHMQYDHTRSQMEKLGWVDHDIQYNLNSWGFRGHDSREFDTVSGASLITLGCSFTYGTGLDQHSIWPQHLADALGLELINAATPGHGLDLGVLWLLLQGHTITNPRALVILEPPPYRLSWINRYDKPMEDQVVGITLLSELEELTNHTDSITLQKLVSNLDINSTFAYYRNAQLASLWAAQKNIPCVYLSARDVNFATDKTDLARDLSHSGRAWHRDFATLAHNKLKQLTSSAV